MRHQSNTTVILSLKHVTEYLDLLTLQPNETSIKYNCDTQPKPCNGIPRLINITAK